MAGARLADLMQRELLARTDFADARTHPRTWELLRLTRMTAVHLELGYLTNPSDARRLSDVDLRDRIAEGMLAAIQRLFLPAELDPPTGVLYLPSLTMGA